MKKPERAFPAAAVSVALLLILTASEAAWSAPFHTRDQNPLLAGFGLPVIMSAQLPAAGQWHAAADFNWGTSAIVQRAGNEFLVVDAETREFRLSLSRGVGERVAVQLQAPYRTISAGALDGFIDDWHDFFSLPEGDRPGLPVDQLRITYVRGSETRLDLRDAASGFGDVSLDIGYQIAARASSAIATWLSVKLPTGDRDSLGSSGAVDAAWITTAGHRFGNRWSVASQAALTWLGDGNLSQAQQRSIVWSAMANVSVRTFGALELALQLDAHARVFDDSALPLFDDTAILTLGGMYRFKNGWQLDIGVSEDLAVERSPDAVFVMAVRSGRR